ncbi:MAG: Ig-like domain-containing protein [Planctomycetia bacterium]|nr:Ig-like domain-containing protein [Planctomycetia bacterium]
MHRMFGVSRRGRSVRPASHHARHGSNPAASRLLYHRPLRLEYLEDRSLLSLAPTGVDLLPGSDSGILDDDNLTNRDNSSAETALDFAVSGTIPGAIVTLYADGIAIGSQMATNAVTTITTDGAQVLADGTHAITARQTEPGDTESGNSPGPIVTIDAAGPTQVEPPVEQIAKLRAGDGAADDNFGCSVSISGSTAIIGASRDDDHGIDSGSAYVFEDTGSGRIRVAKLSPDDGEPGDHFGKSVSISGSTAIVGAEGDDALGSFSGSAYIFQRSASGWIQVAKLTADDGGADKYFGGSVAICGTTAIVGAHRDDDFGSSTGSAYIFEDIGSGWTQTAKLTATDGAGGDYFGWSVSVTDGRALVGAYGDDDLGSVSGSAYVFEDTGLGWTQIAKLTAGDGAANDVVGWSVSISGSSAIVGAYGDDDLGNSAGSAYIFEDVGLGWLQVAKLTADDAASNDRFGWSVSISGSRAIVGAVYDDDLGSSSGSAYIFENIGAGWMQVAKLTTSDAAATDYFGSAVSICGRTAIGGATGDDAPSSNSGSAYLFDDARQLDEDTGASVHDRVTNDTTPELVFRFAEAVYGENSDVVVLDPNGDPVTPDSVAGWGSNALTLTFATPLTVDGEYSVTLRGASTITDTAGNPLNDGVDEPVTFTLDTVAPAAPTAPDLASLSDTGVSDTDNLTNRTMPKLDITAAPYFRVYRDGTQISLDYESGTRYADAGVADGTYEYTVTAIDAAGNESGASAVLNVTIDTQAPTASPALDLQPGSDSGIDGTDRITSDSTPTFDVDTASYFRIYRDGVRISGDFESGSIYTPFSQRDGTSDYTARAVDTAGNESPPGKAIRVTIDTLGPMQLLEQIAKLVASDGAAADYFGCSVSISGTRAIIGADLDDDGGTSSGSAYIFENTGDGWIQVAKLTADDDAADDYFGCSVSISGTRAIIGADLDDDGGTSSGSAYIFEDTGDGWIQVAKLTADDGAAADHFGHSVSISGNTAVVGAHGDDDDGDDSGSAYVFEDTGSGWTQVAKLTASDGTASDYFGGSVSICGHTAVVSAYADDDDGDESGSAYIFEDTGDGWIQVAKLTADDGAAGDSFGDSVSISGTTAIVGACFDDDHGLSSGSAYVFDDTGSGWSQVAKLMADDGAAGDYFGSSVSISGDTAIVGACFDDDYGLGSGSTYVFKDTGSGWTLAAKWTASDAAHGDVFGGAVAISGSTAIVTARGDGDLGDGSGSAYAFDVAPRLSDDTGANDQDRMTSDATPELTVMFIESVYGQDSDVVVSDPNGNPVTPDAIAGWGSDALTVTLDTPLTVDGDYTVILCGTGTLTDAAGNPINNGADEIVTFMLDTVGPAVESVLVKGTAWTDEFLDYLDAEGLGHPDVARLGYRVPMGIGQLDALPLGNLDQITIVFDEDAMVGQDDVGVSGVNVAGYAVADFSYDAATHAAMWTLAQRLDTDRVSITLDGTVEDWAGNTLGGGGFDFAMNVLPGDANHSGRVDDADAAILAAHWSSSGATRHGDFNGDGLVDDRDASILGAHWRAMLPSPSEGGRPDVPPPVEPVPPGGAPLIGPVLLGTPNPSRRRIEPVPASRAAGEARSEAALSAQVAARDAVFAESGDSGPDGETELLRHRLAWSYELAQVQGRKRHASVKSGSLSIAPPWVADW